MKHPILKENFINWYFSDREDYQFLGLHVAGMLSDKGRASVTLSSLLKDCGYVPAFICDDYDYKTQGDAEWVAKDCYIK